MGKVVKVLVAAAAGFTAGILLAPKSGDETMKDIKRKTRWAKGYSEDKTEELKNALNDASKALKVAGESLNEEATAMSESARESAEKLSVEAKKLAKEAKERSERIADEAKAAVGLKSAKK